MESLLLSDSHVAHVVNVFCPRSIRVVVCDDALEFLLENSLTNGVLFGLDVQVVVKNKLLESVVLQFAPVELGLR